MMKKRFLLIAIIVLCVLAYSMAETTYQYAQVSTLKGPLNMRKTASTNAAKIDEIPNGTIITVLSVDDTWCSCVYNNQEGYVMVKYLTLLELSQFQTLSLNSSGQDVSTLKEKLQELYFLDNSASGDTFDSATETAVRLCQAAQGMEETGVASPELQALLCWGSPKNNLPTKRMTVTIQYDCSGYNHVGNSWSKYSSINGVKAVSGDMLDVVLGESITIYSKITENDSSPDVGSAKEDIEITQEFYDNGYTITQQVTVREDKGRYSGKKAYWTITYTFSPQ